MNLFMQPLTLLRTCAFGPSFPQAGAFLEKMWFCVDILAKTSGIDCKSTTDNIAAALQIIHTLRYYRGNRRRVAASEAIGAMLAIAMTLIAGAAAWGFVRSQAGNSEGALQSNAVATNNLLSEHFGITTMYFGAVTSTTTTTFWVYNTGSLTFQIASVRVYDSAGLINLLYSSTGTGGSKTDQVYDLKSSLSNQCQTAASSYESPSVTGTTVKVTNQQFYTLTIPPTTSNCPSYGQTFGVAGSGTTYTVVVTGIYGNSVTFSQQR